MKELNSTFIVNVSRLQAVDYESIVQSLITTSDTVWLQAMVLDANNTDMTNKIMELIDAKLVKLWDYEVQLGKTSIQPSRIITIEEFKEADEYTTQLVSDMTDNKNSSLPHEFTTLNIEMKNTFSNMVLADYCGAETMLKRCNSLTSVNNKNTDDYKIFEMYTKYLFNMTSISSMQCLSVDDILELRKFLPAFRTEIHNKIKNHLLSGHIPSSEIERDCKELSKRYCEMIDEAVSEKYGTNRITEGIMIDILSLLVSPLDYFQSLHKVYDLVFNRNERGFLMYLYKLRQKTNPIWR